MAYVFPKDPQVMTRKGALFVVADGGISPRAGVVASELAVDTVCNAYFLDDSDDVDLALSQAMRQANTAIHQQAAKNPVESRYVVPPPS